MGTAFLGGLKQTVVARGDLLTVAGFGNQITGDIFDHELVVGKISVKGVDDVFPIGGDFHEVVTVVPDGVGKADEIEPVNGHAFPEALISEQPVDQLFKGLGGFVLEKTFGFPRGGWHTDQVEIEPAQKGYGVGLGGEGELLPG